MISACRTRRAVLEEGNNLHTLFENPLLLDQKRHNRSGNVLEQGHSIRVLQTMPRDGCAKSSRHTLQPTAVRAFPRQRTGEGRGLSSKYEGRDEACPVSTGGKGGGVTPCRPRASGF